MDTGGAGLEQAIGEPAGGGAEVDGDEAGDIEMKVVQGVFQFKAAATDIFFAGFQCKDVVGLDGVAGFLGGLAVDADLAGEDGAFGFFAAFTKPALHQ